MKLFNVIKLQRPLRTIAQETVQLFGARIVCREAGTYTHAAQFLICQTRNTRIRGVILGTENLVAEAQKVLNTMNICDTVQCDEDILGISDSVSINEARGRGERVRPLQYPAVPLPLEAVRPVSGWPEEDPDEIVSEVSEVTETRFGPTYLDTDGDISVQFTPPPSNVSWRLTSG